MIKAVFFDVGGVLIKDNSTEILNRQSRLLKIPYHKLRNGMRDDRISLMKGLISRREYLRRMSQRFQLQPISIRSLRPLFRPQRYFRKNWAIARRLRKNGYTVGIISNTMPPLPFVKKSKLSLQFQPVILSWQVKSVKPEKRIFEIARKRGKVKFHEMAFFDDKSVNVAGAEKLGIKTFVYKNPAQLVRSLRRFGVKI